MPKTNLEKMLAHTGNQRPRNFIKEEMRRSFCLADIEKTRQEAQNKGINFNPDLQNMSCREIQRANVRMKVRIREKQK